MSAIREAWTSSVLQVRRRPGSAAALLTVLGVGVAAWSLALVFYDATQRQPTAFPRAAELVDVLASSSKDPGRRVSPTLRDALAWREGSRQVFSSFGLYQPFGSVDGKIDGTPRRLRVQRVSADFFTTLAVSALAGRTFHADEENGTRGPIVVLSEKTAREMTTAQASSRIGGIEVVVGQRVKLDGVEHEVVGVMPHSFTTRGGVPDLWLPLPVDESGMGRAVGGVARLQPGVTLPAARAQLESLAVASAQAGSATAETRLTPDALPLIEVLRAPTRRLAKMLLWVGLAVLATGAVNAAGLLSGRFLARRRELVIRVGLGATEARARGLLIGEGALLVVVATLAGLAALAVALPLIPDLRGLYLHDSVVLRLGAWVALGSFAGAAPLGSVAILVAVAPTRAETLRDANRLSTAGPSQAVVATQRRLVGLQITLTTALLIIASALAQEARRLATLPTGLDARLVLNWEISPSRDRYSDAAAVNHLVRRVEDRLAALPGVDAVGVAHTLPDGSWGYGARRADRPQDDATPASFLIVSREWRRAVGTPLVAGRDFEEADQRSSAVPAMLVSESAAERLFPTTSPLGGSVLFDGVPHEVVGVVGDAQVDPAQSAKEAQSSVYVLLPRHLAAWASLGPRQLQFALRGLTMTPDAATVRAILHEVDPEQPVVALQSMAERLALPLRRPRLAAGVVSLLSSMALLLAALGLGAVIALDVDRRRREIGVRRACGARGSDLLRWLAGKAASPVFSGLLLGIAIGAAALRLWAGLDAASGDFGLGSCLLVAAAVATVAALAIAPPTIRALRLSPMDVLRSE